MNKEINYQKGQEWWEISRNPDPQQAIAEEMNEILEENRWWKKFYWEVGGKSGLYKHDSNKDIKNFWKKWSNGCHFWHPKNQRWYSEKWWTENHRDYQLTNHE